MNGIRVIGGVGLAILAGCAAPGASQRRASSLSEGERVVVTFESATGSPAVAAISAEEVDCVDGINSANGAWCDGGPAANPDDGSEVPETEEPEAASAEIVDLGTQPAIAAALGLSFSGADAAAGLRARGSYTGGGVFQVTATETTPGIRPRTLTTLQAVRALDGGMIGLTIFDTELAVNGDMKVSSAASAEEELAGEAENDGIDCEQEGEHEGENEGC